MGLCRPYRMTAKVIHDGGSGRCVEACKLRRPWCVASVNASPVQMSSYRLKRMTSSCLEAKSAPDFRQAGAAHRALCLKSFASIRFLIGSSALQQTGMQVELGSACSVLLTAALNERCLCGLPAGWCLPSHCKDAKLL